MEKEKVSTNSNAETKVCKYCQSEIPKKAKICLNCHKKQGGKGKWIVIVVVVLLVILAAAGSEGDKNAPAQKTGTVTQDTTGSGEDKDTPAKKTGSVTQDTTGNENRQDDAGNKEKDKSFKVGDVVETQDMKISFLSAGEYVSDNQFSQPKKGYVFYRMEFEFENISHSDQTISSMLSWYCYADGYAVEQSYFEDDQIDATLSPGKKAKGAVYFEVPKDAKEITLEYETDFWSEDKVEFIVK